MKGKKCLAYLLILVLSCSFMLTGCVDWLFEDEERASYPENGSYHQASTSEELFSKAVRSKNVRLKGNGEDTVTILIYMNGSNLETDDSEATTDLSEIVAAGSSDKVNILVQTMGTKKWDKKFGIASDRSQIYKVTGDGLELVNDNLGQLDCTTSKTLSDFIMWGAQNYPADRYILHFWNHGGGPIYGFGYDEWNKDESACLSIDEIQHALNTAGVYFDFIGMDCCIMSCLEVCAALYDYCDYTVLSEEFESGLGWSYEGWVGALIENSSISTEELAKIAIDDMIRDNENSIEGDSSILSLIDESMVKLLYTAWVDFAYSNEDELLDSNYSRRVVRSKRIMPALASHMDARFADFWGEEEEYSFSDYYVTDIMSVAANIDSEESAALESALANTIVYSNSTKDDAGLTGLSVTLPYGDSEFYGLLRTVFTNCGFDKEYIDWLGKFVSADGYSDYYDYDDWDNGDWDGWSYYYDDYDWSDWDYYDDDAYWDDGDWYGWSDWDYDDSWNYWYDDSDWYYDDDDYYYQGDDWYYGDDYYFYDDSWYYDWYYDDYYYDDYYYDDYYYDDSYYDDSYYDDGYYDDGYYDDGYYDDGYYDDDYYYDDDWY